MIALPAQPRILVVALRRLGDGVPMVEGPGSLTPREREVAVLLAEGLSNSERTTTQQRVTRLGVRYGFANKRAGI